MQVGDYVEAKNKALFILPTTKLPTKKASAPRQRLSSVYN